jgi:hypothetical protein
LDRNLAQEIRAGGVSVDSQLVVSWLGALFVLQLKMYWPAVASYRNWVPVVVGTLSSSPVPSPVPVLDVLEVERLIGDPRAGSCELEFHRHRRG